jgi:hypothetical protein
MTDSDPHKHLTSSDIEVILRDKAAELADLMRAVASGDQDIDLKIAEMLEGEPEHVRIAIIEKVKEALAEKEAERSRKIEEERVLQKRQVLEQQRMNFRQWLMWIMSEDTLRRLRDTFAIQPILELKVKNIGLDLFRRGVLVQTQLPDKQDLGSLSASIQRQQGQGREADKGRG